MEINRAEVDTTRHFKRRFLNQKRKKERKKKRKE